jgi:hypothetical protein
MTQKYRLTSVVCRKSHIPLLSASSQEDAIDSRDGVPNVELMPRGYRNLCAPTPPPQKKKEKRMEWRGDSPSQKETKEKTGYNIKKSREKKNKRKRRAKVQARKKNRECMFLWFLWGFLVIFVKSIMTEFESSGSRG